MTWLIVRLRLAMWRTAMSRSTLQLTSSIIGGLAALAVVGTLGPGLVLLVAQPLRITALVVPLFTVVTLMWAVLSLIATGVDSLLDPARFSVLPLRAPELARGLLAAALALWVMDASINVAMEPFRAFVGDMLSTDQHTAGYAVQTAFIGAGAVVNKNVSAYALMVGVPVRQIGWMSEFGEQLDLPLSGQGVALCEHSGARYVLEGTVVHKESAE